MHKFQSTGWPITWFTADQQSNSVNGVVRRFSIHLSLKAWRPVSVICPTHSSGSLFCIWTAVWIKPLSEECALEWKWRYSGLEGHVRATPDIWWQEWGGGGWAACTSRQPPDVRGYGWWWLIENRLETWSTPIILKAVVWPRWVGWALIRLSETYPLTLWTCALWIVTQLLMFNLVGALLKAPAFWPVLMVLKANSDWKIYTSYKIKGPVQVKASITQDSISLLLKCEVHTWG